MQKFSDEYWMSQALKLAQKAFDKNEVPVGCLLVADNKIISKGYNLKEDLQTPLAHAEILAIHRAAIKQNSWRLENSTLYVTLEPCTMCSGTILQARIKRVVYATKDPKAGSVDSLYKLLNDSRLNHQVEVKSGVLEDQASSLLKLFFKKLRLEKKNKI